MTDVIAAIPNYNMADYLEKTLPAVLKQGYNHVYVLDDASTDSSRAVVERLGDARVTFVPSRVNTGAGGARNRVLPYCDDDTLIHFLDADVELVSTQNPATIRRLYRQYPDIAFLGGTILDASGRQSPWNYGPRQTLGTAISAGLVTLSLHLPEVLRKRLEPVFYNRPRLSRPNKQRYIHWAAEANIVISAGTLRRLGGFDESIREHDIQPVANQAQHHGLRALYIPELSVKHLNGTVRQYNRFSKMVAAQLYIAWHYGGLLRWLLPQWLYKNTPRR